MIDSLQKVKFAIPLIMYSFFNAIAQTQTNQPNNVDQEELMQQSQEMVKSVFTSGFQGFLKNLCNPIFIIIFVLIVIGGFLNMKEKQMRKRGRNSGRDRNRS